MRYFWNYFKIKNVTDLSMQALYLAKVWVLSYGENAFSQSNCDIPESVIRYETSVV